MIDPELKYCPKCNEEYVIEAVSCAHCEIPLIPGSEKLAMEEAKQRRLESRSMEISADDDLVTIHKAPLGDIKVIEQLLAMQRIPSLIVGDESSCGKGCCPTALYLNVKREDALESLHIIEAEIDRTTRLDHDTAQYGDEIFDPTKQEAVCPACGCSFSTAQSSCPDCGLCF